MTRKRTHRVALAAALALIGTAAPAAAAPGDLDPTFGKGGITISDLAGSGRNDHAEDVAVQPDGRIVVAGRAHTGPNRDDFYVARYEADGTLDPTFGTGGAQTTGFDNGDGRDHAHGLALQPDGRIVVVGESEQQGQGIQFAVARFLPDGTLDTSFDGDGRVTFKFPGGLGDDRAEAVALDGDNIVVAGGSYTWDSGGMAAVARLTPGGALDSTFSGDGLQTTSAYADTKSDAIYDIVRQPDGKLVAVGHSQQQDEKILLALFRYDSSGELDPSFSSDGIQKTAFTTPAEAGGYSEARAAALQPDGRIVVAGLQVVGSQVDVVAARYAVDGSLDPSFSGDGRERIDANSYANDLALQWNGKLVVPGATPQGDATVLQIQADGGADSGFGAGGVRTVDLEPAGEDGLRAVALQADGGIVAAGEVPASPTAGDTAVVRFEGDARPPQPHDPPAGPPGPSGSDAQPPSGGEPEPRPRPDRPCANRLRGTRKRDVLTGTAAGDRLDGRGGKDVLRGLDGDDCLDGGAANDRLLGGAGDDRLKGGSGNDSLTGGAGANTYSAGDGSDRIAARNGVPDKVNCGAGRDSVAADRFDVLRGCERVNGRSTK
jgi:uncharacterized delta-60 repeat protein